MKYLLALVVIACGLVGVTRPAYSQVVALPRSGWVATASTTNSGESPSHAIDGSGSTRWSTGAPQTAGQWFSIDMQSPQSFSQITLDPTGSTNDWTRGYQVFVSNDAVEWGTPVASGTGSSGVLTIMFPTQTARFVGIVQTASSSSWWSIGEINVYGPGATPTVSLSPTGWVASASVTGGSDVPSHAIDGTLSTRWSTGTPQVNGQWFQVDMLQQQTLAKVVMSSDGSTSDYARGYQLFISSDPNNLGTPVASGTATSSPVTIAISPTSGRYLRIVQTGSASSWWSIAELSVYGVGTFAPTAQVLPRTGWIPSASSSCASDVPPNALDNLSTRWSTGLNQASGMYFQVDMLAPQTFSMLTIDSGSSSGDYPRAFQVFATNDPSNWGAAIASGTGSSSLVTITFPSQVARYVRVTLTASISSNWWSIAELNVYGVPPVMLMKDAWVVTASLGAASAHNAIDGNLSSRWTTGQPQANGQSFVIDMLGPQLVNQLLLDADGASSDYPRGYQVFASNDGKTWGAALASGVGSSSRVSISFPVLTTRYLEVVQTGSSSNSWSIAELNVFGPVRGQTLLTGIAGTAGMNAPVIGQVPPDTVIHIAVGLPVKSPVGVPTLAAVARQVSDPTSSQYRHYLTLDQINATYGPSAGDYNALTAWAQANGLTVGTYPNRLLIDVTGTAAQIERALYIGLYNATRPDGSTFHRPDRDPSIDVTTPILTMAGLNTFVVVKPANVGGSGAGGSLLARDLRNAYAPCTTDMGEGQTIGLIEFNGFSLPDVRAYESLAGPPYADAAGNPTAIINQITFGGFSGQPRHDGSDSEVALDVDVALAMAPKANIVVFEAPNDTSYTNTLFNAAATTGQMSQISDSWTGGVDLTTGNIANEMAALGKSFFEASGDHGSAEGDQLDERDLPSTTVVGGTLLTMTGMGATYMTETAWDNGNLASGGAILSAASVLNDPLGTGSPADVFPSVIPAYQQGIDMSVNHGSTTFRNIPDVSMDADNLTIVTDGFVAGNGQGTSAAAPMWAGFMALVNQESEQDGIQPVGFTNPVLYAIAKTAVYASSFNDITMGNTALKGSAGFSATTGYDLATGLGSPKCQLIQQLASAAPTQPNPVSAVQVAPGDLHTCAQLSDGSVYCWGYNNAGQLGDFRHEAASDVPVPTDGFPSVGPITSNGLETCIITTHTASPGALTCWGANQFGQIGASDFLSPTSCPFGPCHSSSGLFASQHAETMSVGTGHVCALVFPDWDAGRVECWGWNAFGQLGNGTLDNASFATTVTAGTSGITTAIGISAGYHHTCAVLADSTVVCWGEGRNGQLGLMSTDTITAPGAPVKDETGAVLTGVIALAGGSEHTCALMASGDVRCWGLNSLGQLGTTVGMTTCPDGPCTLQATAAAVTGASAVAAGANYSCALVGDQVQCWGDNSAGQLGNGSTTASPTPVTVIGLNGVTSIGAGFRHACAVRNTGAIFCWGDDIEGELGGGNCSPDACTFSPVPIPVLLPRRL